MLRTITPLVGRCTRHNRHHWGQTCPDCTRHAAALRQADELTKRAARSAADRELTEAEHDLAQAIRHVDGINAVIEGFLRIHNAAVDLKRAFAVSDIEAQP